MQKQLVDLRERLLRAGVAPRHVQRYLNELTDHLADLRTEAQAAGMTSSQAQAAAFQRLGSTDELAQAMLAKPELLAWTARVPWAVFSVGPLALLGGSYLIACVLLWTGWQMFLPDAKTPFVPIHGPAIIYFGLGRLLFWTSPIFVGWAIGAFAGRQRSRIFWPATGMMLAALIGGTVQVQAIASITPGTPGHVHLGLTLGSTLQETIGRLLCATAIFSAAALPYFIWKWRHDAAQA
jgi:hypothetical protein